MRLCLIPALPLLALLLLPLACPDGTDDDDSGTVGEVEGDEPGECSDGIDNDGDGLRDCADSGCATAPECGGDDDDAVDDDDDATGLFCPAGVTYVEEVEDNNEPSEANEVVLPPGATAVCLAGNSVCGPVSDQEVYDDTDFFTMVLPSAGLTISAEVFWTDPTLDVDMFLFDSPAKSVPPGTELNTPVDGVATSEAASVTLKGADFTALISCKATPTTLAQYELVLSW
jgi:hypothetical protein